MPVHPAWDSRPSVLLYHYQPTEFFTRGGLALALNRQVVTIRVMENKGIICRPPVKNSRGHWLYTRDQIEDLITLAIEEQVIDPRFHRPFTRRFVEEAHVILRRLPAISR